MASHKLSAAVAKRKGPTDMALMPPPPPPKKVKRPPVVLDEDLYTDALSHIITRDFFPGLIESQAQQDYMDALDSRDNAWIDEAGQNLKAAMTPSPYELGHHPRTAQTPATVATTMSPGRTPVQQQGHETPARTPARRPPSKPHKPHVNLSLSLQAFQAKYTSEDNDSFNGVLDAQNFAKAQKFVHLRNHTNTLPSKRRIAQERVRDEQKLIASSSISEASLPPSQDLSLRPASYDSFPVRQGGRNSLMFSPEGYNTSHSDPVPAHAEAGSNKSTNFLATRLPGPEALVPESPSLSAIDAAIAGRPRMSGSEAPSTVNSGNETPHVKGWKFVDEEPTSAEVAASKLSEEDLDHLLPIVDKSKGPAFTMPNTSKREVLHRRLVDKAAQRERDKLAAGSSRKGGMTPAAKSLAGRLGTPVRGDLFAGGAKKEWTPFRTPAKRK